MPAITLTIGVASCATFIAEYLGLIDGAKTNSSIILHESLKSAVDWLENAKNCSDKTLMQTYLGYALEKFMEAKNREKFENKIAAILGLSMCQLMLGDKSNAEKNIQDIKKCLFHKQRLQGALSQR